MIYDIETEINETPLNELIIKFNLIRSRVHSHVICLNELIFKICKAQK